MNWNTRTVTATAAATRTNITTTLNLRTAVSGCRGIGEAKEERWLAKMNYEMSFVKSPLEISGGDIP